VRVWKNVMAMFDRRIRGVGSAAAVIALLVAGVATLTSGALSSSRSHASSRGARTAVVNAANPFSWLIPARAPDTWTSATTASSGATLFYPPSWRPIPGDRGTVTAALRGGGLYRGYLNVTPREGAEQLTGWAAFRIRRNTQDGDRRSRLVAQAENLNFGDARASCVIDDYLSRVGSHAYREVACIVAGPRHVNVFIGAALVRDWSTLAPIIERAASALIER
jgi:hypothetical protein